MKNLRISYTVYPSGTIKPYTSGMKPVKRPINSIGFNTWQNYIHGRTWQMNTLKQDNLLKEAYSIINPAPIA